jgi:hypothetical protein
MYCRLVLSPFRGKCCYVYKTKKEKSSNLFSVSVISEREVRNLQQKVTIRI